jgi:hypothetical protein
MEPDEIVYPIPLSDGTIVTIHNLPLILSRDDAQKIARVLIALSTED